MHVSVSRWVKKAKKIKRWYKLESPGSIMLESPRHINKCTTPTPPPFYHSAARARRTAAPTHICACTMCHVEPTAAPVAEEPLDPVAVTEAEPVALLCPGSSILGKTKPTSTQVVYNTVVSPDVSVSRVHGGDV